MAQNNETPRRLIWALDPYAENLSALKKSAQVIKSFTADDDWQIEPVYVLSPSGLNWSSGYDLPWPEEFKSLASAAMGKAVAMAKLSRCLPPVVIENKGYSRRADADALMEHAKRTNAEVILLNTHARKGLAKWLLGSFAQEVLYHATTPLLVVNPNLRFSGKFKSVLFPTDLSPESKALAHQIAPLCRERRAKLMLFHKQTELINPYLQAGVAMTGGGWVTVEHLLKDEYAKSKKTLQEWASELEGSDLKVKSVIEKSPRSIPDDILNAARKHKPDLICMDSAAGPATSFFVGSVAREVLRQSTVPVWVLHRKSSSGKVHGKGR